MKDEEKERKMYVVTQRVIRKAIIFADDLDQAKSILENYWYIDFSVRDIKTQSIEEVNPLKSNEEVEKDGLSA